MAESAQTPLPHPTLELRGGTNLSLPGGYNRLRVCRYGLMLYNHNDIYVGRSFDLYGQFSEGEVECFRQVVRKGDTVLDIGANIGAHTLPLAMIVGDEGAVYAFEPLRLSFQTLCANMALNSITCVRCYPLALDEKEGMIDVPVPDPREEHNFGGIGLGSYHGGETMPVARVDGFELKRCRLIKVDVEGMELGVLKGAEDTIRRLKPALYVENDRKEKSEALARYIDSLDYNMYWHRPPLYDEDNFLRNPENVFPGVISQNMLCLHKKAKQQITGLERIEMP